MTGPRQQNWAIVKDGHGIPLEIEFREWRCQLVMERYADHGGLSLRLVDAEDLSSIARATANVTDAETGDDEILIKNYSENAGVLEALVAAGVINDTGRSVQSEFADLHRARLAPLLAQQWHNFRDDLDSRQEQQRQ